MSTERISSRVCGSLCNCPVSNISARRICGRRGKLIHTTVRAAQDIPTKFEKGVGVTGIEIVWGNAKGHRPPTAAKDEMIRLVALPCSLAIGREIPTGPTRADLRGYGGPRR